MPYINIKINCKKSDELKEKIVSIVLENTSTILHKKKDVTSILLDFVSSEDWYIGEKKQKTFYLDIKVTKGTNTKDEKTSYINKTYFDFKDLLGDISPASYINIDEVDADSWGFEGLTQEHRYIKSKKN